MNFLHPGFLALGLGGLVLPFAIHWLTRPRPVTFPLSTVRFVRDIVQQRRARYQLRDLLILLLRAGAVLLLAWAFARPLLGNRPAITLSDASRAVRVVIVDSSLSMKAQSGGIQAFERARGVVSKYLGFQSGTMVDLVLMTAHAEAVFDRPTTSLSALKEAFDKFKPRPEGANVQAAINLAGDILAKAGDSPRSREVVIVSDFQRTSWSNADFSPLPKNSVILLKSVAPASTPPNFAVLNVVAKGRVEEGREVSLQVQVGNYSPSVRIMKAQVTLANEVFTLQGECPAGKHSTLTTQAVLPAAGWYTGEAKLLDADDALPDDNERTFVLHVQPAPVYALITREASSPRPTSSHFLERALVPNLPGSERTQRVIRMRAEDVDRGSTAGAAVFVVDRPGPIPEEAVKLLASLVRRGKALFYVASEPTDAANLKLLSDAAGSDLQFAVEYLPPNGGVFRRGLSLGEVRRNEPPFSIFGDDLEANLQPLRFGGGLATRHREGGLSDSILASYNDGSAALTLTSCGAGSVAVLNADLEQSSLIGSRAFVPLVAELVGRQLTQHVLDSTISCGDPATASLPPEAGSAGGLTVEPPQPGADPGSAVDVNNFVVWHTAAAGGPGVFTVKREGKVLFQVASAAPASESDLESISPDVLEHRLAGGRDIHYEAADNAPELRDRTWTYFFEACAGLLLVELVVLLAFRS